MAKANDRVEGSYLRAIMHKLGFAQMWIDRIMACVESVSFSVRVNGKFSQIFKPTRGFRQGDPISSYLFLLCSEGLTSLLKSFGTGHLGRGIRVGIHAPLITHLLFADDCLIFTQASHAGARRIHDIFEIYRRGTSTLDTPTNTARFA